MKIALFALVFTFTCHTVFASSICNENPAQLIANYQVNHQSVDGTITHDTLTLARLNNQVGQYYHAKNYGDLWSRPSEQHLLLTRYFPDYQKAIEYQTDEIKVRSYTVTWQQQWQLLTDQFVANMERIDMQTKGCNRVEVLTAKVNKFEYTLHWLPALRLVEKLVIKKKGSLHTSWQLSNINHELEDVQNYVNKILTFQTIDYADIGDNEADPFLAKMIHQGFKEGTVIGHSH
ncbi:hypothetical protein Q4489_03890 [Thalassotalea sp. 1_MG-2023]|uniref:hypothetical protein n=1 Tax=Thalassotalea sp. 1_MG-2023 TaxID=3062680 RepID=UPI0026E47A5D|nr:hypothetical protein [Thalassotalea sp. 1_MG-2023]MDO6426137.1 hypothetical protein [Thalassotalea sp. 1_MG-2023]